MMIAPIYAVAQRIEVYTDANNQNIKYLAVYAYGLPREVVKTNDEMRSSMFESSDGSQAGVIRRHHTSKGIDEVIGSEGYNGNQKLSFAFVVAPHNVDSSGNHTQETWATSSWSQASGWDTTLDTELANELYLENAVGEGASTLASTPTGCAAYAGPNGGEQGQWRLPTQREMLMMFTVIDQAVELIRGWSTEEYSIVSGDYWTATELNPGGGTSAWKAWYVSNITGFTTHDAKTKGYLTRCVKDIYETINE